MAMLSSSRLAVLASGERQRQVSNGAEKTKVNCRRKRFGAHRPSKSRLSSLQALMETSAEPECLFIISTRLTWRPLASSRERILPAGGAEPQCTSHTKKSSSYR